MRTTIDFSRYVGPSADAGCFNTACGGCSSWRNWDGTPAKVGDPCRFHGVYACDGTNLICGDNSCPSCAQAMEGTICGADGHTIYLLSHVGPICSVSDSGSATAICAKSANDKCLGRCVLQGNTYRCTAACASAEGSDAGATPDGGAAGCEYNSSATCTTLAGC